MTTRVDNPQAAAEGGIDVAADRRREGRRLDASSTLLPLLRGEFDPSAAPDPQIARPRRARVDAILVSGALIVAVLLSLGAMLRYVV